MALMLAACGGSSSGGSLPPATSSGGQISIDVSPTATTTQPLQTTNGITPTVVIPSGATSTAFVIDATSSTTAPAGTPSLAALGIGSTASYVTFSSSGGPAALSQDMTVTIPASGSGSVSAIFIPDGKTGNTSQLRTRSNARRMASTPSSTTPLALEVTTVNGTWNVEIPFGTYTGTLALASNSQAPTAGCLTLANIGDACLTNVSVGSTSVSATLNATFDSTANGTARIEGFIVPYCYYGTVSVTPDPPAGVASNGDEIYTTTASGTFGSNGVLTCGLLIPMTYQNEPFLAQLNLSLHASTSGAIVFYHPTDTLGSTVSVSWPANPGSGPMRAIPAEFETGTHAFVYPVDSLLASGTMKVTPNASGSSSFCTGLQPTLTAYTASGTPKLNASSFPFPADALDITIPDAHTLTDVGACNYVFSDGTNTSTAPVMVNPITISSGTFNGSFYQVSASQGGSFTLNLNPAAYQAAGLSTPTNLKVDNYDESFVNPIAGVSYAGVGSINGGNGAPGVYSCNTALGEQPTITANGNNTYTLGFLPTATDLYPGTLCELYLQDGVTNVAIDIWFDVQP